MNSTRDPQKNVTAEKRAKRTSQAHNYLKLAFESLDELETFTSPF